MLAPLSPRPQPKRKGARYDNVRTNERCNLCEWDVSAGVERGGEFEIRGKVFPVSGDGIGVYVRALDEDGRKLEETLDERGWERSILSLGGSDKRWKPFMKRFTVPERTRFLQVWIHSYNSSVVEAYLDDIELARAGE